MMKNTSPKICLISLGCPKNLVDAEMMLGFLKKDGFEFTTNPAEGDVIVVNTCSFVEDSKKESIQQILEMARYKEEGNCKVLVATGCLSQRYSEQLSKEMPEVDLFVGTGEFDKLSELLKGDKRIQVTRRQILPDPDLPRIQATPKHYTYLKISEGCSHRCSFCIIPHIRGDLISRPIDSIVREVQQGVERGIKEFNLIAQDLNEYGKDLRNDTHLTKLLTALNHIPGDFWLRPLYMYPLEFTDRLIGTLRDSEHLVKYVDMPLQHINDRVMRSMKRGSPSRYVRQVLDKLKTAMPQITIRSTFIVGYPGETQEEFQELYDFVKDYEFDRVGVFQYSIEEGTSAALLEDQLPSEIKKERYHQLMSLQQKISLKKNQALVGKILRVLCENPVPSPFPSPARGEGGREMEIKSSKWNQARLSTQAPEIDGVTYLEGSAVTGEFVEVKITKAQEYDLVAQTPIKRNEQ